VHEQRMKPTMRDSDAVGMCLSTHGGHTFPRRFSAEGAGLNGGHVHRMLVATQAPHENCEPTDQGDE